MLSAKQSALMLALNKSDTLTTAQAVELVGGNIYCNAANHVGAILARMVKRGLLIRVKPGVFKRAPNAPQVVEARGWWED